MKRIITFLFIIAGILISSSTSWAQQAKPRTATVSQSQPNPDKSLQFIENKNQWDKSVKFMAPLPGGNLYLQKSGFVYAFYGSSANAHDHGSGEDVHNIAKKSKGHAYGVSFLGAQLEPKAVSGKNATAGYRNYFLGNDPAKWASHVKSYEEVIYTNLYAGIDMHLYEQNAQLKYDFILQPHTDPAKIRMQYKGADRVTLQYGSLHIKTSVNEVTEQKPIAYQTIDGKQIEVPCLFKLDNNVVSFEFPKGYDANKQLIIDPVLVFSTFSGSSSDNWGFTATYDNDGNMYSGGIVNGNGFPATLGAFDTSWNGNSDPAPSLIVRDPSGWDIGILKYKTDASGAASFLYATYLGGSLTETPSSLVVNSKNELLILGTTSSANFPTTAGVHDRDFNASSAPNVPLSGIRYLNGSDLIISKLSANGDKLEASTFLGGSEDDGLIGKVGQWSLLDKNYGDQFRGDILTDASDNIYIASNTHSTDFPILNGFQGGFGGGAIDAVIAKFSSALTLQWSSFLGGAGVDAGYSIQLDASNNLFIAGGTSSTDLPGTTGAFKNGFNGGSEADGFVAKINNDGSALQRLSYVGTSSYDQVYFVQLDSSGDVYLLGQTEGSYPVSAGVFSVPGGRHFIHKLNNNLTTSLLSTVFGSATPSVRANISPTAFLVDNCNRIYVAGWGGGANAGENNSGYLNGNTRTLPVTSDATKNTTDGKDFYLMLLSRDASALEYATFFGADQVGTQSGEHVDGGTSRFDKRGFVYQAVCGGCGRSSAFPTTPNAWSRVNNSPNCNNAVFKYDINILTAVAGNSQTVCANAAPFQLTGFSPATGGTWSGEGVTAGGFFTPGANLGSTVTLTYSVASGSCISTSTKTITINPAPVVSFTGLPPQICLPSIILPLAGLPAGGTFSGPGITDATFDPAIAGVGTHTITYTFTNNFNCTVTTSQSVTVTQNPEVNAGPDEQICSGSFPMMLTGFSPAGGTWSGTGVSANGLFTPSEQIAGTHLLTYTVTRGFCAVSQTKTVIVDPTVKFTQGPAISLCPDGGAYTISTADIMPLGGVWSGKGVSPTGVFTPSVGLVGTNTLTYFVTLGACSGISTKDITISAPPSLVAAAVPTECGSPTNIQGFAPFTASFTNASTGATGYLWDFGDGTTSTEMVPTHQYTKNGSFEVTLTAFYGNGCRLKQKVAGVVVEKKEMIPNIFTPNKDGINDTFVPRITCLPTNLKIYNRWGKLVYEKENYQNTWGAEGITDGIYYYQLTSSKGQHWKGWVEIVR